MEAMYSLSGLHTDTSNNVPVSQFLMLQKRHWVDHVLLFEVLFYLAILKMLFQKDYFSFLISGYLVLLYCLEKGKPS